MLADAIRSWMSRRIAQAQRGTVKGGHFAQSRACEAELGCTEHVCVEYVYACEQAKMMSSVHVACRSKAQEGGITDDDDEIASVRFAVTPRVMCACTCCGNMSIILYASSLLRVVEINKSVLRATGID